MKLIIPVINLCLCIQVFGMEWVGYSDLPSARAITISGNYAYVAQEDIGLSILDISSPVSPRLVGELQIDAPLNDVVISDSFAYITASDSGFYIVDIGSPTSPSLVGRHVTSGKAQAVAVAESVAFVALGSNGISAIDLRDPANPILLGTKTGYNAVGIDVQGKNIYIASPSKFFFVFDVSKPDSLVLVSPAIIIQVGGIYQTSNAQDLHVSGDLLYLADGRNGIRAFNISDPTAPVYRGTGNPYGFAKHVLVSGYLYVSTSREGLVQMYPGGIPVRWANFTLPFSVNKVAISGAYAFCASNNGVHIVDKSDRALPYHLSSRKIFEPVYSTASDGNLLYVAGEGFEIYSLHDPLRPEQVGNVSTFTPKEISFSENYAVAAHDAYGLRIVDISDSTNPQLVYSGKSHFIRAKRVIVIGDHCYLTSSETNSGLYIFDISNPTSPTLLGSHITPGKADGLAVSGGVAYVADSDSGLQIVDISNPSDPVTVAIYKDRGHVSDVALSGDYAFVGHKESGISVLDISNPANPLMVNSFNTPGIVKDILVSGKYALIADFFSRIPVYDISNPLDIKLVSSVFCDGAAQHLTLQDNYLISTNYYKGFSVMDVGHLYTTGFGRNGNSKPTMHASSWSYSNPFKSNSKFHIRMGATDDREGIGLLEILNLSGQLVQRLFIESRYSDEISLTWDGRNRTGDLVEDGMYLIRLILGTHVKEGTILFRQ